MISKNIKTPDFHKINYILVSNNTLTVGMTVPKHRENLQHIISITKKDEQKFSLKVGVTVPKNRENLQHVISINKKG
jgi:hypothetical protein